MNIYESICAIMQDVPAIAKAQRNSQQGFYYRGVDAVMNVFQPLLAKHKVFVVPTIVDSKREERQTKNGGNLIYTILQVCFTFYAEDGTNVCAIVQGEGMDSADKSGNKAMSVAFKYAMFQVFCIPTEEMKDPDADSPDESVPMVYTCADCGRAFDSYTDKNGNLWTAQQVFQMAAKRNSDGKARCNACRKRHEQDLNAMLTGEEGGEKND